MAYLDNNGVLYLWGKIKAHVSAAIGSLTIPTKTSDLTNDSGFITSADVPEGATASTSTPIMDGIGAVGTSTAFARGDHVHPSDTSKVDLASFNTTMQQAYQALNGKANASDVYTKTEVDNKLVSAYIYKGSVATYSALPPSSEVADGWVYNVESTGMNYAWNGSAWDALGESFQITAITNAELDSICT